MKKIIQLVIFFSILTLSVLYTNANYHFGDLNQVEHLPHIYVKIDKHYLERDFYTSYAKHINPRYYYSLLLAKISKYIPVKWIFYLLTLFSNFMILAITYYISKILTSNYLLSYLVLLILILFNEPNIGKATMILDSYLTPQLMAISLVLISFVTSLKRKYWTSSLFLILSIFIHPTIAILMLLPTLISIMFNKIKLQYILFLFFTVFLVTYFAFIRNSVTNIINDKTYIYLLAYFRHPHHYIPSSFPIRDYYIFILLEILYGITLWHLIKLKINCTVYKIFFITNIYCLFLMFIGYLFVEIIPVKQIVQLQVFRIVFYIRWTSIITITITLYEFTKQIVSKRRLRYLLVVLILIIVYSNFIHHNRNILKPDISPRLSRNRSKLFEFILNNTDKNALFITPYDFGDLRTNVKRAIIVDWKSFPFNEKYMVQWYSRIRDIYGDQPEKFDSNYHQIGDVRLFKLKNKYNANYAILYTETETNFKISYSDSHYKLVNLKYFKK